MKTEINQNMTAEDLKKLIPRGAKTVTLTVSNKVRVYRAQEIVDFVGINGMVEFDHFPDVRKKV